MKKIISLILALIIPVAIFSGCGKRSSVTAYTVKAVKDKMDGVTSFENDKIKLSWDGVPGEITITNKITGKEWNNNPKDKALSSGEDYIFYIKVQDTSTVKEVTASNKSAKTITTETIDNGVKFTYYFDKYKISVPVCYTLRSDSVEVSVDGSKIQQGMERYQLTVVSPSPMLCRVYNNSEIANPDSYLFTSPGIGGVTETSVTSALKKQGGAGTANVASMDVSSDYDSAENSGCRCFGIKDGNDALFCVGEENATAIGYSSIASDKTKKFSVVSPVFYFTDYDYFYGASVRDGLIKQVSDLYKGKLSMGIYPLSNDDANYVGMAKCYRKYLIKAGYIDEDKKVENSSPYAVTYLGAVSITNSVLGIKTKPLNTMTTFDDAKSISETLNKEIGYLPTVRLKGYGEDGIDIGQIAGGYGFNSKVGNNKSRENLESYFNDNKGTMFTDFGLIYFSKSGGGFSYSRNYTKTAVLHASEISPVNVPLRDFNTSITYRLLARRSLGKAVDKLIKMAEKKDISGISLNDLGTVCYSDYTKDSTYGVTGKIDTETKGYIEKIAKEGHKVAVSGGAYFSGGISDVVFDAPIEPSGDIKCAFEVPFFQLVFHGTTAMYSNAVNTATNPNYNIMLAASTGTGIGFNIINNYETSFVENTDNKLAEMLFEDNKSLIVDTVKKYEKIYKSVESSEIIDYEISENGISKTTFKNGKCIYANHNSFEVETPAGTLGGYDFTMVGEN